MQKREERPDPGVPVHEVLKICDAISQILFSAGLIADILPRLWERNPQEGRLRLDELRRLTLMAQAELFRLLQDLRLAGVGEAEPGCAGSLNADEPGTGQASGEAVSG